MNSSLTTTRLSRLFDKTFVQTLFTSISPVFPDIILGVFDLDENVFFLSGPETATKPTAQSPLLVDNQLVGTVRTSLPAGCHQGVAGLHAVLADFWGKLLSQLAQKQWEQRCITHDSLTRYRELALLYQLGEKIGSCLDQNKLAEIILSEVRIFIKAQAGSLMLTCPKTGKLGVTASYGAASYAGVLTNAAYQLAEIVLTSGKSEIVDDACLDPRLTVVTDCLEPLLCVPLKLDNHILGVINLSHKADSGCFSSEDLKLTEVIASQAATAFETARLFHEIEDMAYSIILVAGATIDERDTCTSGHSSRVANISLAIAKKLNQLYDTAQKEGRPKKAPLIKLQEMEYAALLHDIGKIGVPEAILTKRTRLSPDRLLAIKARFDLITVTTGQNMSEELSFLRNINEAHSLSAAECRLVQELTQRTYIDLEKLPQPFLLPEEAEALCVSRGNLMQQEFEKIQTHAEKSYRILKQIPFPSHLHQIPDIAYQHHERLNGNGYPNGLSAGEILLESKILCVADVFEALTASDRPYRSPLTTDKALDILRSEAEAGYLDPLIVDVLSSILTTDTHWWQDINNINPEWRERKNCVDQKDTHRR